MKGEIQKPGRWLRPWISIAFKISISKFSIVIIKYW